MKQLLSIILIIFQLDGFTQTGKSNYTFDHTVLEVKGDLNKDNLVDKVVVTQDTLHENAPYRLQIFSKYRMGN